MTLDNSRPNGGRHWIAGVSLTVAAAATFYAGVLWQRVATLEDDYAEMARIQRGRADVFSQVLNRLERLEEKTGIVVQPRPRLPSQD